MMDSWIGCGTERHMVARPAFHSCPTAARQPCARRRAAAPPHLHATRPHRPSASPDRLRSSPAHHPKPPGLAARVGSVAQQSLAVERLLILVGKSHRPRAQPLGGRHACRGPAGRLLRTWISFVNPLKEKSKGGSAPGGRAAGFYRHAAHRNAASAAGRPHRSCMQPSLIALPLTCHYCV